MSTITGTEYQQQQYNNDAIIIDHDPVSYVVTLSLSSSDDDEKSATVLSIVTMLTIGTLIFFVIFLLGAVWWLWNMYKLANEHKTSLMKWIENPSEPLLYLSEQQTYILKCIEHPPEPFLYVSCFRLVGCLIIDAIGILLAFLPIIGQTIAVVWGTLSALLIYLLFRFPTTTTSTTKTTDTTTNESNEQWRHLILIMIGWVEESLPIPLIGVLPTAFLVWLNRYWPILANFMYRMLQYGREQWNARKKTTTTSSPTTKQD